MANIKNVVRTERMDIYMTKEEKELWVQTAKDIGINPSRLARNIILDFAESKIDRNITKAFVHMYKKYHAFAENQEIIDRLNSQ